MLRVDQTDSLEELPVQQVDLQMERQTVPCHNCGSSLYPSLKVGSEIELGSPEVLANEGVESGRHEFKS